MKAGPELDVLVAEKVMGMKRGVDWHWPCEDELFCDMPCPRFSTCITEASKVEAKIGEGYDPVKDPEGEVHDRVYRYLMALHELVGHPIHWETDYQAEWALLRATPHQRCLAALKVMGIEVPE